MDQQKIIADLEAKVKAAGMTLAEACRLAGVHPTTFSRWKLSEKNPAPVQPNLASIMKLHTVLALHSSPTEEAA